MDRLQKTIELTKRYSTLTREASCTQLNCRLTIYRGLGLSKTTRDQNEIVTVLIIPGGRYADRTGKQYNTRLVCNVYNRSSTVGFTQLIQKTCREFCYSYSVNTRFAHSVMEIVHHHFVCPIQEITIQYRKFYVIITFCNRQLRWGVRFG